MAQSQRTAEDVIERIRWDESIDQSKVTMGYLDRFVGAFCASTAPPSVVLFAARSHRCDASFLCRRAGGAVQQVRLG
jgi:hypothetical protein